MAFLPSSVGLRSLVSVYVTCMGYHNDVVVFSHKKECLKIFEVVIMRNVCPPPYTLNGEIIAEMESLK